MLLELEEADELDEAVELAELALTLVVDDVLDVS